MFVAELFVGSRDTIKTEGFTIVKVHVYKSHYVNTPLSNTTM
jgi:hypothetical protein